MLRPTDGKTAPGSSSSTWPRYIPRPSKGPYLNAPPVTPVEAESPFKGKTGITRIIQAFFNSLTGLADAWRHESAFRQEILLAIVLIPVAFYVPVTAMERALLISTVLLVVIVEL